MSTTPNIGNDDLAPKRSAKDPLTRYEQLPQAELAAIDVDLTVAAAWATTSVPTPAAPHRPADRAHLGPAPDQGLHPAAALFSHQRVRHHLGDRWPGAEPYESPETPITG